MRPNGMENAELTARLLAQLRETGIRISIDDFGTGYSSLVYLKDFPIQTLKIDRSFVQGLTTNDKDAAITKAIIAMADSLKLNVIAEGVETEEQLAFLRQHGCCEFQGYLLAAPMSAESLERVLSQHKLASPAICGQVGEA